MADLAGIANVDVVVDSESVEKMLNKMEAQLNPVALGVWLQAVIAPYLRERAESRFQSEGDDVVGKWAPLQPSTIHIREEQGFGGAHPINVRTGDMEDFVTGGSAMTLASPLGATLTWPGNLPVGELAEKVRGAQQGAFQEGRQPSPPRPVIGVNERDLMFVMAALSAYIMDPPADADITVAQGGNF